MKISRENIDALNAKITVVVEKSDYEQDYKKALSKHQVQSAMKGFRKGKTPISMIRKMYGEGSLTECVNGVLQKSLYNFLDKEKMDILGDPIPEENHAKVDFNTSDLQDFEFTFDVGLSPEFEPQGVSDSDSYELYDVEVGEKSIDEEIEQAVKRLGSQEPTDEQIEANDIIEINAKELLDAKEKEGGHETTFKVYVDTLADDIKDEVLKLKKGGKLSFDIYQLEKDKDENYVMKYLLNLEEGSNAPDGCDFTGEITEVTRLLPAEINQEFFDKYFGEGKVKSEEEARDFIKDNLSKYFSEQARQFRRRKIMDHVVEINKPEFPEGFLKRWLMAANDKLDEAALENEFPMFKQNLVWTLIKKKLNDKYDIAVDPEEVKSAMRARVQQYVGQYNMGHDMVENMVGRLMEDKEQINKVYEEIQATKIFEKVEEEVGSTSKSISIEDFSNEVKSYNERITS